MTRNLRSCPVTGLFVLLLLATPAGAAPGPEPEDAVPPRRSARAAPVDVAAELARLERDLAHEPTVAEIQRAAVRRAEADPAVVRSWVRRVRRAGWLPEVQGGLAVDGRKDRTLDREAGIPDQIGLDRSRKIAYDVKLSWDLGRLIFDPNELKVSREAQRVSELRDQVLTNVTRLYFERRRLQLLTRLRPPGTIRAALERHLRIAELTAVLEALTGARFDRARRRPPRAR